MKSYLIHFGKEPVGKVRVSRQGLYYCFQCRCNPSEDTVARLIVANGSFSENLGILVPMGNGFGLDTRRPVKLFTNEEFSFELIPKGERICKQFVPIYPDEPFSYLNKLKQSYLVKKNGVAGILLV